MRLVSIGVLHRRTNLARARALGAQSAATPFSGDWCVRSHEARSVRGNSFFGELVCEKSRCADRTSTTIENVACFRSYGASTMLCWRQGTHAEYTFNMPTSYQ